MSKGTRKVLDLKTGEWREGKAAPWLPPESMRALPQDATTRDPADGDRIHELDFDYVASQLEADYWARQRGEEPNKAPEKPGLVPNAKQRKYREAPFGVNVPLSQEQVDFVRFRVIRSLVNNAIACVENGFDADLSVRHLWFPHDNVNIYELREGAAPPRSMRPKRLRELELEVDVLDWPKRIKDILQEGGHKVPDVAAMQAKLAEVAAERREMQRLNDEATKPWQ